MLVRPKASTWRAIVHSRDPYYHVRQSWQLLSFRKAHKLAGENEEQPFSRKEDSRDWRRRRKSSPLQKNPSREDSLPRQGTIQTKRPSIVTRARILENVEIRFPTTSKSWEKFAGDAQQAVIILATPSFAKWLEDEEFITGCITRLTRSIVNDKKSRKVAERGLESGTARDFELDVLCACVDGLSPNVNSIPYSVGQRASEGFSILQGRTVDILPDLWDSESSSSSKSPTRTASLTFTRPELTYKSKTRIQTILPLANTLFSNGRHSTLLISRWRAQPGSFVKVRSLEKENQAIHAFDIPDIVPNPNVRVPATPLTPARRIASGLGNIVKQIDFGEEGCGPASRELEANIDEYLAQTQREKSTIAIWALVVPKGWKKPPPQYELLQHAGKVRNNWDLLHSKHDFIGYWVRGGAKFCRVLSGGGGWGAKQGLLSLDPQTTLTMINEARFDFSMGSLEEQQNSALGNITEADSFIQFFVASTKVPAKLQPKHPVHGNMWRRTTVIGTVPSTIDDQMIDEAPASTSDKLVFLPGHFGAVSESGMFLRTTLRRKRPSLEPGNGGDNNNKYPPAHTKIDLPYSYVYRDMVEERDVVRGVGEQVVKTQAGMDDLALPVRGDSKKDEARNASEATETLNLSPTDVKYRGQMEEGPPEREKSNTAFRVRKHFVPDREPPTTAKPFRLRKFVSTPSSYEPAPFPASKHLALSNNLDEPTTQPDHSDPIQESHETETQKPNSKEAKPTFRITRRSELRFVAAKTYFSTLVESVEPKSGQESTFSGSTEPVLQQQKKPSEEEATPSLLIKPSIEKDKSGGRIRIRKYRSEDNTRPWYLKTVVTKTPASEILIKRSRRAILIKTLSAKGSLKGRRYARAANIMKYQAPLLRKVMASTRGGVPV